MVERDYFPKRGGVILKTVKIGIANLPHGRCYVVLSTGLDSTEEFVFGAVINHCMVYRHKPNTDSSKRVEVAKDLATRLGIDFSVDEKTELTADEYYAAVAV